MLFFFGFFDCLFVFPISPLFFFQVPSKTDDGFAVSMALLKERETLSTVSLFSVVGRHFTLVLQLLYLLHKVFAPLVFRSTRSSSGFGCCCCC